MKPRAAVCMIVMICLLFAPAAIFGKKGEKNFRQGIKFEANQDWDRAVQEFVLAVANDPSNMEYQTALSSRPVPCFAVVYAARADPRRPA